MCIHIQQEPGRKGMSSAVLCCRDTMLSDFRDSSLFILWTACWCTSAVLHCPCSVACNLHVLFHSQWLASVSGLAVSLPAMAGE